MTRRAARGFTLVEMMVALAIGLAVVGSLLAAYLVTYQSGRHSDALVQMTEDATLALTVMRQQVAQAGYSAPSDAAGAPLARHAFPAVFGCAEAHFRDLQAGIAAGPGCQATAGDASDALEIAYEASVLAGGASNGVLGGASGREPLDCLGNGFPKTPDPAGGDFWLADSKFYVSAGSLYCHGPGNAAGGALAQNVDALRVRYGFAAAGAGVDVAGQAAFYDVAPAPGAPEWADVVAVTLCVQVRSETKLLTAASAAALGGYVDCDDVARTSVDGYLHRSFTTTVVLQNRLR